MLESMKMSYSRVLACVVEAGKGGIKLDVLLERLEKKYGKICGPDTAMKILERLVSIDFIYYSPNTEHWFPAEKGRAEYSAVLAHDPARLTRKTTSSQVPMHA